MLTGWLDHHRGVLRRRAEGLSLGQLATAPLATSPLMTLGGLLCHLTAMEVWWFAATVAGEDRPLPWTDADPDGDWRIPAGIDEAELLRRYDVACAHSDVIIAQTSLDAPVAGPGHHAAPVPDGGRTLRWVLTHMLEETARHNGHADLVRELLDGTRGGAD